MNVKFDSVLEKFREEDSGSGGEKDIVGTVIAFAGSSVPSGYLLCNGAAVSRTDYAALFAVIGTTYGAGDGSTTYGLPDLVDKFVQGSATAGTAKAAGVPNIQGDISMPGYADGATRTLYGTGAFSNGSRGSLLSGLTFTASSGYRFTTNFAASNSSSIYGNSSTVQPPALTLQYCIKY